MSEAMQKFIAETYLTPDFLKGLEEDDYEDDTTMTPTPMTTKTHPPTTCPMTKTPTLYPSFLRRQEPIPLCQPRLACTLHLLTLSRNTHPT